jgi:hypothetical protein
MMMRRTSWLTLTLVRGLRSSCWHSAKTWKCTYKKKGGKSSIVNKSIQIIVVGYLVCPGTQTSLPINHAG